MMARSGAAAGKNLIIQNGKWLIPRTGFLFPVGERTGWTRVLMAAVVPAAMCIVLWLFVRLAGVRPAWPVVFGGLAIALIIGHIYQRYFLAVAIVALLFVSLL
jgi:hypothetical protein